MQARDEIPPEISPSPIGAAKAAMPASAPHGSQEWGDAGSTLCALLRPAVCHEFYAGQEGDAITGIGAILALRHAAASRPALLWVRPTGLSGEIGQISPAGLAEYGQDPADMLLVRVKDARQALKAGLEGARCKALGAVLIEMWGEAKAYDLTASRRLALAAKASGTAVFLLRAAARPCPSAAETRWLVKAAPSRPLIANAPGPPAFDLTLLRARTGREGLCYRVEWDRNVRRFLACSTAADVERSESDGRSRTGAALSGAVVSFPFGRPDPVAGARQRDTG